MATTNTFAAPKSVFKDAEQMPQRRSSVLAPPGMDSGGRRSSFLTSKPRKQSLLLSSTQSFQFGLGNNMEIPSDVKKQLEKLGYQCQPLEEDSGGVGKITIGSKTTVRSPPAEKTGAKARAGGNPTKAGPNHMRDFGAGGNLSNRNSGAPTTHTATSASNLSGHAAAATHFGNQLENPGGATSHTGGTSLAGATSLNAGGSSVVGSSRNSASSGITNLVPRRPSILKRGGEKTSPTGRRVSLLAPSEAGMMMSHVGLCNLARKGDSSPRPALHLPKHVNPKKRSSIDSTASSSLGRIQRNADPAEELQKVFKFLKQSGATILTNGQIMTGNAGPSGANLVPQGLRAGIGSHLKPDLHPKPRGSNSKLPVSNRASANSAVSLHGEEQAQAVITHITRRKSQLLEQAQSFLGDLYGNVVQEVAEKESLFGYKIEAYNDLGYDGITNHGLGSSGNTAANSNRQFDNGPLGPDVDKKPNENPQRYSEGSMSSTSSKETSKAIRALSSGLAQFASDVNTICGRDSGVTSVRGINSSRPSSVSRPGTASDKVLDVVLNLSGTPSLCTGGGTAEFPLPFKAERSVSADRASSSFPVKDMTASGGVRSSSLGKQDMSFSSVGNNNFRTEDETQRQDSPFEDVVLASVDIPRTAGTSFSDISPIGNEASIQTIHSGKHPMNVETESGIASPAVKSSGLSQARSTPAKTNKGGGTNSMAVGTNGIAASTSMKGVGINSMGVATRSASQKMMPTKKDASERGLSAPRNTVRASMVPVQNANVTSSNILNHPSGTSSIASSNVLGHSATSNLLSAASSGMHNMTSSNILNAGNHVVGSGTASYNMSTNMGIGVPHASGVPAGGNTVQDWQGNSAANAAMTGFLKVSDMSFDDFLLLFAPKSSKLNLHKTVRRAKELAEESGQRFLNLDQQIHLMFQIQHHYKLLVSASACIDTRLDGKLPKVISRQQRFLDCDKINRERELANKRRRKRDLDPFAEDIDSVTGGSLTGGSGTSSMGRTNVPGEHGNDAKKGGFRQVDERSDEAIIRDVFKEVQQFYRDSGTSDKLIKNKSLRSHSWVIEAKILAHESGATYGGLGQQINNYLHMKNHLSLLAKTKSAVSCRNDLLVNTGGNKIAGKYCRNGPSERISCFSTNTRASGISQSSTNRILSRSVSMQDNDLFNDLASDDGESGAQHNSGNSANPGSSGNSANANSGSNQCGNPGNADNGANPTNSTSLSGAVMKSCSSHYGSQTYGTPTSIKQGLMTSMPPEYTTREEQARAWFQTKKAWFRARRIRHQLNSMRGNRTRATRRVRRNKEHARRLHFAFRNRTFLLPEHSWESNGTRESTNPGRNPRFCSVSSKLRRAKNRLPSSRRRQYIKSSTTGVKWFYRIARKNIRSTAFDRLTCATFRLQNRSLFEPHDVSKTGLESDHLPFLLRTSRSESRLSRFSTMSTASRKMFRASSSPSLKSLSRRSSTATAMRKFGGGQANPNAAKKHIRPLAKERMQHLLNQPSRHHSWMKERRFATSDKIINEEPYFHSGFLSCTGHWPINHFDEFNHENHPTGTGTSTHTLRPNPSFIRAINGEVFLDGNRKSTTSLGKCLSGRDFFVHQDDGNATSDPSSLRAACNTLLMTGFHVNEDIGEDVVAFERPPKIDASQILEMAGVAPGANTLPKTKAIPLPGKAPDIRHKASAWQDSSTAAPCFNRSTREYPTLLDMYGHEISGLGRTGYTCFEKQPMNRMGPRGYTLRCPRGKAFRPRMQTTNLKNYIHFLRGPLWAGSGGSVFDQEIYDGYAAHTDVGDYNSIAKRPWQQVLQESRRFKQEVEALDQLNLEVPDFYDDFFDHVSEDDVSDTKSTGLKTLELKDEADDADRSCSKDSRGSHGSRVSEERMNTGTASYSFNFEKEVKSTNAEIRISVTESNDADGDSELCSVNLGTSSLPLDTSSLGVGNITTSQSITAPPATPIGRQPFVGKQESLKVSEVDEEIRRRPSLAPNGTNSLGLRRPSSTAPRYLSMEDLVNSTNGGNARSSARRRSSFNISEEFSKTVSTTQPRGSFAAGSFGADRPSERASFIGADPSTSLGLALSPQTSYRGDDHMSPRKTERKKQEGFLAEMMSKVGAV